jgi:tetratricopeptide (TPR) repeat protein
MRGKKANKVATKRLKIARRLMQDNRPSEFYDEVLRALWGYVGDKLNIPVEQLSHDNINQRLSERQVDESTIALFMGALDECEFERYAPGDPKGNMNKVFEKAMTAIEKIEESYKSYKSGKTTRSVIVFLLLMLPVGMHGVTKAEADSAYTSGHYQRAIKEYQSLLKNGVSADLYYNLGNAYYRSEEITQAIIAYERALQLAPGDKDIRFNLQMARNKTIDKITPETEMFFITWYHSVVNLMGVDGWAQMALVSLAIAIVLALLYLFSDLIWLRKLGFFGALLLLAVFFLSNLFAWQQKETFTHRRSAVITVPAVAIKSTPAKNGTDLFILHEGTKVTITDNAMKDWKEIRIADGKEGWIETEKLEMI